jgi:DNA-binding winged helix-turn-helix (wHTH) protein
MNSKPFILNNQFWIYPQLGLVKQTMPVKESRLEPRLMQLLCILAEHKGELVSRELLTKEVWDDYGNADEGLTQAISYLRKLLNDDTKELIETVPKNGYVLHAIITAEQTPENIQSEVAINKKKAYWAILAVAVLLITAAYLLFIFNHKQAAYPADVVRKDNSADTPGVTSPDLVGKKQKPINSDALPDTDKKAAKSPDVRK